MKSIQNIQNIALKMTSNPIIEEWAGQIRSVLTRGATHTLELARVVWRARQIMPYGWWAQMWRSRQVSCSQRKGEMLVVIWNGLNWVNAQTSACLPLGWNVLYYLAQLDRSGLEMLIQQGTVHPGLTLREARALLAQYRGEHHKSKALNVGQRLRRFREFVLSTLPEWTPEQCESATTELAQLADWIATRDIRSQPLLAVPIHLETVLTP